MKYRVRATAFRDTDKNIGPSIIMRNYALRLFDELKV